MKGIRNIPKRRWSDSIIIGVSDYIRFLIDKNLSLMNNESKKASLYGKIYFDSFEYASFKLTIALNDVRISVNKSLLGLFINLSKKFRVYE